MFIVLFSYRIVYNVVIGYIPYQLIYGLHLSMPIKYVLLAISGDHKDAKPTIILTTKL
jgi:hypothetical protein